MKEVRSEEHSHIWYSTMNNSTLNSSVAALAVIDEPPVFATFDSQTIGMLYARHTTPSEYMQYILLGLKQNGAPIEGSEGFLHPAHGVVCKCKTSPRGKGYFTYCWVPDQAWKIIQDYRKDSGIEAWETGMVTAGNGAVN